MVYAELLFIIQCLSIFIIYRILIIIITLLQPFMLEWLVFILGFINIIENVLIIVILKLIENDKDLLSGKYREKKIQYNRLKKYNSIMLK